MRISDWSSDVCSSDLQKNTYLPRILSGDDWWCQGFSEPQAGSDLASLQMRAVRDGDDYVVNGTKLWTSWAHMANKIFCLVRTSIDGPKQAGISFLLLDMEQPGVTVSPILNLGGMHAVNAELGPASCRERVCQHV